MGTIFKKNYFVILKTLEKKVFILITLYPILKGHENNKGRFKLVLLN